MTREDRVAFRRHAGGSCDPADIEWLPVHHPDAHRLAKGAAAAAFDRDGQRDTLIEPASILQPRRG